VGGILFLVFGVMAGFYFGSYGTLFILQKLMGGTVEPTLFVGRPSWSASGSASRLLHGAHHDGGLIGRSWLCGIGGRSNAGEEDCGSGSKNITTENR